MLLDKHCGGCGNGNHLARWLSVVLNMEKLNIGMNVKKYQNIDKYDSFITHQTSESRFGKSAENRF